ncbi:MAG: hypothetical protein Q4E07_02920 [Eubacteriales bacterium]|nr:hypothetical protein [Eubacteriales bacterium]
MTYIDNSIKSYLKIFIVGIFIGCITRLLDFFSLETLWSFSSIQTALGFWIITNTLIVVFSSSNIAAGVSSFLYMFGMTLSFYGLLPILGIYFPTYADGFRLSLFLMFTIFSNPFEVSAYNLFYWNNDKLYNSILHALPVGALFSETVAVFINLVIHHTFLFQFIMDITGGILFMVFFSKKVKNKRLYFITILISMILFYFALYHREVSTWF